MTIAEIESTLQTLAKRHPNLDEALLRTLLTASGWEEKTINEAMAVFKVSRNKFATSSGDVTRGVQSVPQNIATPAITPQPVANSSVQNEVGSIQTPVQTQAPIPEIVYYTGEGEEEKIVPVVQESPVIERKKEEIKKPKAEELVVQKIDEHKVVTPVADVSLSLPKNEDPGVDIVNKKEMAFQHAEEVLHEPESLIVEKPMIRQPTKPIEIPENLPLKPFETTPHIWPFSKYKEVFHSQETSVHSEENIAHTPDSQTKTIESEVQEPQKAEHHSPHIEITRSELDGEDEGLIFLTGIALLVILLLLAYMYSNGRL
jgi:hypothetical protein